MFFFLICESIDKAAIGDSEWGKSEACSCGGSSQSPSFQTHSWNQTAFPHWVSPPPPPPTLLLSFFLPLLNF